MHKASRVGSPLLNREPPAGASGRLSVPFREAVLSRRGLLQAVGGLAAAGTLSRLSAYPALAAAQADARPRPIPGGSPVIAQLGGTLFHVYGPGADGLDPDAAEPITITDFDGLVGLAYMSGMVQRTNMATGEVQHLPFVDSDMRFMKGRYQGMDGQVHNGAFAFI